MAKIVSSAASLSMQLLKASKPKLQTFLYYASVELTPPKIKDIPQIKRGFANLITGYKRGTWKQLTVKEAFLNTLVTTEVICWFFVGECIGKGSLIGYHLS